MKRNWEYICMFFLAGIFSIISPLSVNAEITLSDIYITNVTPTEFSIVWRASEIGTPLVSVFSNSSGTIDITTDVEIVSYPLMSGDPDLVEDYFKEESKDILNAATRSTGLMMAKIRGTSPDTDYFVRIGAANTGGEHVFYPENGGTIPVRTMVANEFIIDAKHVLVTFTNNAGDLAADGWIAIASTDASDETQFSVSAVVGDGTGRNQAFIDLSNFFGLNHLNWTPQTGSYVIKIEILGNATPVEPQLFTMDLTDIFHISDIRNIPFNIDSPPDSDNDGLSDFLETRENACTHFLDADSDDDGIPDGEEDLNHDGIVNSNETSPCKPDTDNDGVHDGTETRKIVPVDDPDGPDPAVGTDTGVFVPDADPDTFTDPLKPDTDNDGLADGIEDANHNGALDAGETDPADPDTDEDGIDDSQDIFPLDTNEWADNDSDGIGDNADTDDDNDGLPDLYETDNGLNPLVNDAFDDSDNDGYSNFREFLSGSLPSDEFDLPPVIADADMDDDVDGNDFSLFIKGFGKTGCDDSSNPCVFDLDNDGDVDDVDLFLFSEDFGRVEN
jgi:hypothetical protein